MSDLHSGLGALAIGLNVLAAVIGLVAWIANRNPRVFWLVLRAGQGLIMLEAVTGAALLLDGKDLPRLHLVYGLTPIAVAFLAEQLKLLATQTLLDKRGFEGGADVAEAPGIRAASVRQSGAATRAGSDGDVRLHRRHAGRSRPGRSLGALWH